jgi:adenosylhomocysteine nucleosidase
MRRPWALVSALHDELAAVLDLMPDEAMQRVAGRDFWVGHLQGRSVIATLSGIGKVAAATTATLLIERFGVQGIVFTGLAGGLGDRVRVGDVVVARALIQHDMDARPLFPRHMIPDLRKDAFVTHAELGNAVVQSAQDVLSHVADHVPSHTLEHYGLHQPSVHEGLILSGDRFVSTAADSDELVRRLPQALAVEMEGAAMAQVCHDFDVPLAVVRTISDRANDSAHVDFKGFLRDVASHYSAAMIERLVPQLPA